MSCLASFVALLGPFQAAPMLPPGFSPACIIFLISRRSSLISLIRATFSCAAAINEVLDISTEWVRQ